MTGNVPLVDEEAQMAKRFSLILDRLTRQMSVERRRRRRRRRSRRRWRSS